MYIRLGIKYKYIEASDNKYLAKGDLYVKNAYIPMEENMSLWREVDCAPENEEVDSQEVMNRLNNLIDSIS